MKLYKKIIPTQTVLTVRDINFDKLKEQGVKALFFDLDNTLIPYDINLIPEDIKAFLEDLNKDFKVVVVSNSRQKRVGYATSSLEGIPYVKFSRKPLKFGFKKALKLANVKAGEVAIIGDQLMTDIFGANRLKAHTAILVFPIKQKSDHILTRFNRKIENRFIRKVAKKDPEIYNEVLKDYAESK